MWLTQVRPFVQSLRECGSGLPRYGSATTVADEGPGLIEFAQTVATGQTAVLDYLGSHTVPHAGDDLACISVPAAHLEALIAFVEFRADWQLETQQAYAEASVSVMLAQLSDGARRAWTRYREVMQRLDMFRVDLPEPMPSWHYA